RTAYEADITYVTAKEAGFDYLRDSLCLELKELTQRKFNMTIVDEADFILIDEARIPLVIAEKIASAKKASKKINNIINELKAGVDYDLDEYSRNIYLTEAGVDRVEEKLGCGNIYSEENYDLLLELYSALHANILLKRDVDYIVKDRKVELVDEFTGRIADRRALPDGLQAAVEAKEGLSAFSECKILNSITMQHFIKMYPKLCGMTGTASTSSAELMNYYGLEVAVIPTNKLLIRKDYEDYIFTTQEAKLKALISEIQAVHATGRPILVGTASIEESEKLAKELQRLGAHCNVLNAKNDEREAAIISKAGSLGAVTVSTNMAGRGTDIRLGGENEERRAEVVALGGLYVIGANKHESCRVDNQLRGRSGRQGDPGSSRFFISLEDDLIKRYGKTSRLFIKEKVYKSQVSPIENPALKNAIRKVQKLAEGQNEDIRLLLWRYSNIVEAQRQIIFSRRMDILKGNEDYYSFSRLAPKEY
ncbi:MAG: accessory Sec system translocase SecA2, partial [Bacillota bacterium]|nr:accessory Sec system translocase SecA2 [Bacillota bacterium]